MFDTSPQAYLKPIASVNWTLENLNQGVGVQLIMSKVESSNLDSYGYDKDNHLLAVQFKGGGLYLYHGVPAELAGEMDTAESKGSFFNQKIKANYNFTKVQYDPVLPTKKKSDGAMKIEQTKVADFQAELGKVPE